MLVSEQGSSLQSAFYSGYEGLTNGQQTIRQASAELAQSNAHNIDLNRAAVNLISGELQTKVSAEVIKRADGLIGTIIDTYA
ncbi:MAG: hypothetical protein AAGJ37_01385 [Pseudomonadota bacterium]